MAGLINGSIKPFVSLLLDRFLKPYVENFDSRKLDLGIFSGSIMLKNLNIKKGALDKFRLPVDVVEGHLGELQMKIPWTSLGSTPVEIFVEDVFLLVIPGAESKVDLEEDERRAQAAKQERLASAELLQSRGKMDVSAEESTKQQGFAQALITKITNNVQVTVKNIHIRYEDKLSCPGHPFAAGFTLAGFSAHTTDGNWQKTFLQSSAEAVHKLAKLQSLAIYFNTDSEGILGAPREEVHQQFKSLIANEDNSPNHQYILKPVTGEGHIIINHHIDNETPRYDASVLFKEIGLIFDDDQYRDAISMVDMYHFYIRQAQYRKHRPSQAAIEENPRRALLKFAGQAILREVHEKNRRWTWAYFKERRDDRKKYVSLYKTKLIVPTQSATEASELAHLEEKLSYEDIRFYRSISRSEIKKDRATQKRLEIQKQKEAPQASGGWLGGWWKSSSAPANQDAGPGEDGMTEDQRKELYDVIDYDEKKAVAQSLEATEDALKMRVTASLEKGSFSLRTDSQANDGNGVEVISLMFDDLRSEILQRTENLDATLTLGGFRVYDGTTPDSLYHQIVKVKDEESSIVMPEGDGHAMLEDLEPGEDTAKSKDRLASEALFYVHFEQNPLDGRADSAVVVRMKAMEIIYHKGYVEAIYNFFRPPESQLESVGALLDAATATLGELRDQTRAGLEYALQRHKTIDVKLDMKSPIIIIPEDVRYREGHHLVLDAGHISVKSDLVPKSSIREIQAKKNKQYSDEDFRNLESLMYDRFSLKLEAAQLLIGNDLESCMNALSPAGAGDKKLHVVERINLEFGIQITIIPDAPNLPKCKVRGKLPSLRLNFSNTKYKGLMRLVDVAIPKFGDPAPAPSSKNTKPRPDMFTLPSNMFRRAREYNVDDGYIGSSTPLELETHSPSHVDEDGSGSDQDEADTFVDAEAGDQEKVRAIQQRTVELSFEVESLQASLFKANEDHDEKELAFAILQKFVLGFALTQYGMEVKVTLRSMSIDMVDGPNQRTPLLESFAKGQGTPDTSGDDDLVRLHYIKVQKDSPDYMSVHEGIDQTVSIDLSTFVISAAPEPILTLYDFMMSTFVSPPTGTNPPTPSSRGNDTNPMDGEISPPVVDTGKIRVRVKLTSIQMCLLNNREKIATLALSAADVALFLRAGTLRVGAKLGGLVLTDDSAVTTADPSFSKILSIEGDDLADFSYETFDPNEKETFPGVNSSVFLRLGALKFNFLEHAIQGLYQFTVKFARMKSLYDAATQAAVQRASEVQKMKFELDISSPIIIFPRNPEESKDVLVVKLGAVKAGNQYEGAVSTIKASLIGIRLTSSVYYRGERSKLKIIEDVQIDATVIQTSEIDRSKDSDRPETGVQVNMSDVKVSLTQAQYIFLISTLQSIPRVLASAPEAEQQAEKSTKEDTTPSAPPPVESGPQPSQAVVDLGPELSQVARGPAGEEIARWKSLDVRFEVQTVRLQLFDQHATHEANLRDAGIAKFTLSQNIITFKTLSDGSSEAEVTLKSFTVSNTRSGTSRFREIIPAAQHDRNQFMVLYTTTGGNTPSSSAVVAIDSPKFIVALEPLFALLDFFTSAFPSTETKEDNGAEEVGTTVGEDEISQDTTNSSGSLSLRADLHEFSVSILENDADSNTQAIELAIQHVYVGQQGIMTLAVERLGMFLTQMNKPSDKVSFLDEVDLTVSMDTRHPEGHIMTSIEAAIKPLVLRASYRDIKLITTIVNKALARMSKPPEPAKREPVGALNKSVPPPTRAKPSRRTSKATKSRRLSSNKAKVIMSKEKIVANFDGFRLVLIGDIHELPMFHFKIDSFVASCIDWSGELQAEAALAINTTYWNLTNSHWEPLFDPWKFSVTAGKDDQTGALSATVASSERLDINLSATFIELALTTMNVWAKEGDRVLEKGRGGDAPYRISNETGTPVQILSDVGKKGAKQATPVQLNDGQTIDWRFDDWKTLREHVSASRNNSISVQFVGKAWEQVRHIPVDREGEYVYVLRPRVGEVSDRILCEVTVKDNVKYVTLRSTYKFENHTLYNMEIILVDARGKPTSSIRKLSPGDDYSVPIEAVRSSSIQVRPDPGFGYTWPNRPIRWEDLCKSPSRDISCPFRERGAEVPFHIQTWASYDPNDPALRSYPRATVSFRAPMELENLLPFDIKYIFYDKVQEKNWSTFLRKGGLMPVHCVTLDQFVLLNVEIQDTPFKPSEFAIVNVDEGSDFTTENVLRLTDKDKKNLDLGINYMRHPDSGGAFRIQVYSPFLLINKTNLPFSLRTGNGKLIAGLGENNHLSEPVPFMFSHSREHGSEFSLKLLDSAWSKDINLDAPSADADVSMNSPSVGKNVNVGVSWTPGLGKYKLTKVVTLAPRFMLRNGLEEDILYRETGDTTSDDAVQPKKDSPILFVQGSREPALSFKYRGVESEWSSPINMQDIGAVHVRLARRASAKPELIRVEVSIEGSTIWIVLKKESGPWPFAIENSSDYEITYCQTDERKLKSPTKKYVVRPHSREPYAWDAPAAREKRVLLMVQNDSRAVDIMEIGDLVPFKFKGRQGSKILSLDIRAEGPTQVLEISNYSEDTSLYKRRARAASVSEPLSRQNTISSQSETFEAVTEEIHPSFSVNLDLEGIGVSLINKRLVEVVYLTLSKLKFEYTDSEVAQTVNLALGWIQIDNQLHEAMYPIVLQPMVQNDGNGIDVLPAIQASAIVLKDSAHGVTFIKYASILLQVLQIQMDEDFLFALLDLTKVKGVSWEEEQVDVLTEYPVTLPEPKGVQTGEDLYFEVLELQPIRLALSFMRTERVNADEKLTTRNPLAVVLNALTMTIGNINDAPLRMNALAIKDMRLTVPVLQERIIYHYKQEVIRQLYRVLGSADFIGNPVGLFTNVSSGVADIFYEPYKGVVMHGSKELGIGIAKGAASFAKKTVFGVTDSMTKFTGSIGKGLSAATFDPEYQRQRRLAQRQNKPRHAIYGVTAGVEALGTSALSGLEGVLMKPIEGAESGGAFGFVKGVGKGMVGFVTKPVVGFFDLASNITEGIRNTTTVFDNDQRNRKRIPRHTPSDGILTAYSQREALGQSWMKDLEQGKYRNEKYVAHLELPGGDAIIMVTTTRVIAFSPTRLRLRWDMAFNHVERVIISDNGIKFADKAGRDYDKFVTIADPKAKSWFFQEIEKVINQWNANRRVER